MNLSDEAKEFLKMNGIEKYTINSDGMIDVGGSVKLIVTNQSKFPVKFGIVSNYFDCGMINLTSLEGAPNQVYRQFYCDQNKITSLEGAPSYVNGNFYCHHNELTSLHDVHKHIKEVNGGFYCHYNPIEDSVLGLLLIKGINEVYFDNKNVQAILRRHLGQGRAGVIGAQQELLDAGLDKFARL